MCSQCFPHSATTLPFKDIEFTFWMKVNYPLMKQVNFFLFQKATRYLWHRSRVSPCMLFLRGAFSSENILQTQRSQHSVTDFTLFNQHLCSHSLLCSPARSANWTSDNTQFGSGTKQRGRLERLHCKSSQFVSLHLQM